MSSETLALIAIIVAAACLKCIALNPKLRSTDVIQLLMAGLSSAFPKKK